MEFGIFLNGYIPGPGAHDTEWEHSRLDAGGRVHDLRRQAQLEVRLVRRAPLRSPSTATCRRPRSSWATSPGTPTTSTSPPASRASRRARSTRSASPSAPRCSTTSPTAGSSGAPAGGAGSHEMASFNILDKNSTKPEWEEVVREIPRMWEQVDYESTTASTSPCRRRTTSCRSRTARATRRSGSRAATRRRSRRAGELGIGAIAFNFEPIFNLRGRIDAYKNAIVDCTEPLGQFKNDNVMMTNAVICFEDRDKAREIALDRVERLPRDDGEPLPRHDAEVARRDHVAERADRAARHRGQ